MKFLLSIVLSVVLSVSSILGLVHYMPEAYAKYDTMRQVTWQLTGDLGTCTTVAIKENLLLTAAHCDQPNMVVAGVPVVVLKKDAAKDLMLLASTRQMSFANLAQSVQVDEEVVVVGYPLGIGPVITTGLVQGFDLISAQVAGGNSGGPVFNRQGEIVGIVSATGVECLLGCARTNYLTFVVPLNDIKTFLQ